MPGRYALDGWKNYLLGIGRHLHIPSGGESVPCSPAIPFEKENLGGKLSLRFTVHVDNGYPYNPAGFVYHMIDRKSTRLNSSHPSISYAVFCLKKKKKKTNKRTEKLKQKN